MDKNLNLEKQVNLDCEFEEEINNLKIKEKEASRYIYVCEKKIKEYQDKLKKAEERLEHLREATKNSILGKLNVAIKEGHIQKESIKETLTQATYTIPSAKFIFKKEREKLVKKCEIDLLNYLKEKKLLEYVKLAESTKWGEYKKTLTVKNGNIVSQDGEIVHISGVKVETEEESFEIKYL